MSVNTTHPQYDTFTDVWKTLRDAYEGSKAIRKGGTRYLPRPGGMKDDTQWNAYLDRPEWFNATRRTILGLVGAVFRKEPSLAGVEQLGENPLSINVTGTGVTLQGLLRQAFQETLHMGRYGLLLDLPAEQTSEPKPLWCGYRAEDILNWRTVVQNGRDRLVLVVLREIDEEPSAESLESAPDGFTLSFATDEVERVRVLSIDDAGFYRVDRWQIALRSRGVARQRQDDVTIQHIETLLPTRRNERLPFIPFVFLGPCDTEPWIEDSPVLDLVRLNLRHWRHSADYEHGLHYTALPSPWITGHNPEMDTYSETGKIDERNTFVLGSGEAMVFPEPEAKVGLLTLSDSEFGALKQALETDKEEMATHGARLLEDRPDVQETATALRLRHSGDESVLKSLAMVVSEGATTMLRWHLWWAGLVAVPDDEKISLALNTDFMSLRLSQQDVQALMQLRQEGEISSETLYYQLEQGEITQPGVSFEEERVRIESRPPLTMRLGDSLPIDQEEP